MAIRQTKLGSVQTKKREQRQRVTRGARKGTYIDRHGGQRFPRVLRGARGETVQAVRVGVPLLLHFLLKQGGPT